MIPSAVRKASLILVAFSSAVLSAQDQVHPISDDVELPIVIESIHAAYTPDAMKAHIEGRIRVGVIIEADGSVSSATLVCSLDTINGLDEQALKAAKQWRFRPAMKAGEPVAVSTWIDFTFAMYEPGQRGPSAAFRRQSPQADLKDRTTYPERECSEGLPQAR